MMKNLKDRLVDIIPRDNIVKYLVPWLPNGFLFTDFDHGQYIKKFQIKVQNMLINGIKEAYQKDEETVRYSDLGEEVLIHLKHQKEMVDEVACDRKKYIDAIEHALSYVYSNSFVKESEQSSGMEELEERI